MKGEKLSHITCGFKPNSKEVRVFLKAISEDTKKGD